MPSFPRLTTFLKSLFCSTWCLGCCAMICTGCAGRTAPTGTRTAAGPSTNEAVTEPSTRAAAAVAPESLGVKKESVSGGGEPFPAASPRAVVSVTKEIFPAVVRLDVAQEIYTEGKRNLRRGIGSGVIID